MSVLFYRFLVSSTRKKMYLEPGKRNNSTQERIPKYFAPKSKENHTHCFCRKRQKFAKENKVVGLVRSVGQFCLFCLEGRVGVAFLKLPPHPYSKLQVGMERHTGERMDFDSIDSALVNRRHQAIAGRDFGEKNETQKKSTRTRPYQTTSAGQCAKLDLGRRPSPSCLYLGGNVKSNGLPVLFCLFLG